MRYASRGAVRALMPAVIASTVLGLAIPPLVAAQTVIAVGQFKSVTLRNGGHVTLRHGSAQRVTLIKGTTQCTGVAIADGDRLVIDGHQGDCPRGTRSEVEVLTPGIVEIRVEDGGAIQTRGRFPRQAELDVAVESGGMIDLRSMAIDQVSATVQQGGRIFAKPQRSLNANIAQGGAVTYWGNPHVTSSIEQGGVVTRGAAADADKPLDDLGPGTTAVPPVPPLPPARVRRARI